MESGNHQFHSFPHKWSLGAPILCNLHAKASNFFNTASKLVKRSSMASKIDFQTEFVVGIEALWNAITKDKLDLLRKAAPQLLTDAQVIEGDGGLGTLTTIDISAAAPHVPPIKEKIVEFDEGNHAVSFQGIEGGFLKLGFTHYKVSFKLDDLGDGKILAKTTITYELEKDMDGTQLVEEFTNFTAEYLKTVATYLHKAN